MPATQGQIDCKVYPGAFSGEVVFQVDTAAGSYEGIAPKHYANVIPEKEGVSGRVMVFVLSNGGNEARISAPDGQILTVSAEIVHDVSI